MNKFAVLLVAVLAVFGIWFGGWFLGAAQIGNAIAELADADGEEAPRVTCARQDVGGFPFRFDITCEGATIAAGDMTVTVGGIRATVLAYNPTQAKFSALAPVTLADAYSGAENRIDFAALEGSASLTAASPWRGLFGEGWRIRRVSVLVDGLDWIDTVVGERLILSASHAESHLIDIPERHDPDTGTAALATYVQLNDAVAPAYGIAEGEAVLEAEVSGLPDDLRAFESEAALAGWREAGGALRLVRLRGTSGEDFVESSGTLSLDGAARLDGQVAITSRGVVERFGASLPEEWKGIILGTQAADGSYSQTLNIRAGVVFAGLLPVAMVPPLM